MLTILLLSSSAFAGEGCWQLLKEEAAAIDKRDGYQQTVGAQFILMNEQLVYYPGISMRANIENWAEDFEEAIKYGPMLSLFSSDDDYRKEILDMFRKDIAEDCILPKDDYKNLQVILRELVDEGAFCPEGKLLSRPLLGRWKHYKKVVRDSVKAGRFQELCQSVAIQDSSDRVDESGAVPVLSTPASSVLER